MNRPAVALPIVYILLTHVVALSELTYYRNNPEAYVLEEDPLFARSGAISEARIARYRAAHVQAVGWQLLVEQPDSVYVTLLRGMPISLTEGPYTFEYEFAPGLPAEVGAPDTPTVEMKGNGVEATANLGYSPIVSPAVFRARLPPVLDSTYAELHAYRVYLAGISDIPLVEFWYRNALFFASNPDSRIRPISNVASTFEIVKGILLITVIGVFVQRVTA